jgi:hypothetical protein
MAKCNNCSANLGCSCQVRTASDGRSVCSNCVMQYENMLKLTQNIQNINLNNYNR